MSENYSPGPGVGPAPPYDTAFLSQRDLGLRVPINYVTSPGVSLQAACFPSLRYEDDNSGDCLSNLLAVGFRRFEIDLYWDDGRRVWSFCPVAVPTTLQNITPSSSTTLTIASSSLAASNASLTSTLSLAPSLLASASGILGRQVNSVTTSIPTTTNVPSGAATSLGDTLPTIAVLPSTSNEPLISIGPYVCTTTINLSTFTSQLLDYLQKTDRQLSAHLIYVIVNIRAAASDTAPTLPAPSPKSLPGPADLLGDLFSANLSSFLYTRSNLMSDRANLNGSWYTVSEIYRPVEDYYFTDINGNGIVSTDDGWPSESYIEFARNKRLLLGWGDVDPQMAGYNFTSDSGVIFPEGFIQDVQTDLTVSSTGHITQGCFLRNNTGDLSQVNSSWAVDSTLPGFNYPTSNSSDILPLLNLTLTTTNCGISPILNVTLLDSTAHDNYIPYQNFSYSTIWSWAPGEPRNYTSSADASSSSLFRCASTTISSSATDYTARWIVSDCSSKFFAACRAQSQPYNWTITPYPISYSYADQACSGDYDFAAPRTALENSYLSMAMTAKSKNYDGHGVWVDFNSLNVEGCWTTGGPNATCPYSNTIQQADDLQKKIVLVPTIAAIIVLIITALTVFVKVAGNRKVRKRSRRRANNGFVYEGVPS